MIVSPQSMLCNGRYTNGYADFRVVTVHSCNCNPIAQQLIQQGLFPAAPEQPRVAVALELLGLYRALFERSCDAVNALAESLHSHYGQRGFHIVDKKVKACLYLRLLKLNQCHRENILKIRGAEA